jgi:uncharacterized damage-inducible protein DinB
MTKTFRKGAVGALLDEYERVIEELEKLIESIPDSDLTLILDPVTSDEDCRSLQTIFTHVVYSGYGYATSIHNSKGHNLTRPDKKFHLTIREYIRDLKEVFTFTDKVFTDIRDEELIQQDESHKIRTGLGQLNDIEQLTEHAIVHILRHRRQVERLYLSRDSR